MSSKRQFVLLLLSICTSICTSVFTRICTSVFTRIICTRICTRICTIICTRSKYSSISTTISHPSLQLSVQLSLPWILEGAAESVPRRGLVVLVLIGYRPEGCDRAARRHSAPQTERGAVGQHHSTAGSGERSSVQAR